MATKIGTAIVSDVLWLVCSMKSVGNMKHKPSVSLCSPFQLILSEKVSVMVPHETEYCDEFLPFLHLPTKPPGDFFTIADVYHNGTSIRGEFVNLLVAVRDVGIAIWCKSMVSSLYLFWSHL
jgi:hypothetical protein